jgi:hemolysin III
MHVDPTDRFSFVSHALGALLAIVGLVALLARGGGPLETVSMCIYGISLVIVFSMSAMHHAIHPKSSAGVRTFKLMDHIAIFVFIAGTYTPMSLVGLGGAWGWSLFGIIWGLAAAGILVKVLWRTAPRWVSTIIYIAMGWTAVAFFPVIYTRFPIDGFLLMLAGGVVYTVGAVIYARKRPDPFPRWMGFHGFWHLFVLVGAGLQFAFVYGYVA